MSYQITLLFPYHLHHFVIFNFTSHIHFNMSAESRTIVAKPPFPHGEKQFQDREDKARFRLMILMSRLRMAIRAMHMDIWEGQPYWYNVTAELVSHLL